MKRIIYSKFDKSAISELPRVTFPGEIVTVTSEEEAEKAVEELLHQPILGVDTETRPVFHKGQHHLVALLKMGVPSCIIHLLEDTTVPKIGLSLGDDMNMLHHRVKFSPGRFIDLQKMVSDFGIKDLSLQKLYANIFHERISKREQLSNWESDQLNPKQQLYAATDAWTCINLYETLTELRQTGDYELVKTDEEDQHV